MEVLSNDISSSPTEDLSGPASKKRNRRVDTDYLLWCEAHHGDPLNPMDPQFYDKLASLLTVMAGAKIPPFVLDLLKQASRKNSLPGRKPSETRGNHINSDVLKKLDAMRRTQNSASRREFAVLLGEVLAAVYRQFSEILKIVSDDVVEKSMTNLTVGYWNKGGAGFTPSVPVLKEIAEDEECGHPTQPIEVVVTPKEKPLPEPKPRFISTPNHHAGHIKLHHAHHEESVIEIQFTLNGLSNGRDATHCLHPVLSGTSIVREPTIDSGEHCHKSKGMRHAGWKSLRRLGRRLHHGFEKPVTTASGSGIMPGKLTATDSLDYPYNNEFNQNTAIK